MNYSRRFALIFAGIWFCMAAAASAAGVLKKIGMPFPQVLLFLLTNVLLLLFWKNLGFTDILFVVSTAARLGLADPQSMKALTRLPLALLPTFLVPIIIATHLLLFFRLAVGHRQKQP